MGDSMFDDFRLLDVDTIPLRTRGLQLPKTRHTDPPTSKKAARSVTPGRLEERIYQAWEREDPHDRRTADEVCDLLPGEYAPSIKTALSRMAATNLVWTDGMTRPSTRGRESLVWHLVPRRP